MPSRFLSFHNGHASLFEYYHGPERKVYTDPRLEVAGPELFKRYIELEHRLQKDEPGWEVELAEMGRPVILTDHEYNASIGATLLQSNHWRCVWFDAIAAVFVHDSYASVVQAHAVDFAARHFRPDSRPSPTREYGRAGRLGQRVPQIPDDTCQESRPSERDRSSWLGLDAAREHPASRARLVRGLEKPGPDRAEPRRDALPSPRIRAQFDPVFDLSLVRATYALRRALEVVPTDFMTLVELKRAFDMRLMNEAALPVLGPDRRNSNQESLLRPRCRPWPPSACRAYAENGPDSGDFVGQLE